MEVGKVRQLRTAEPFQPFTLTLADGRRFNVIEPYYIAISPKQDLVLVVTPTHTAWFSPNQIVDAVPMNGQPSK